MPTADWILLAIAAILAAISLRGYLRTGRLLPQHKTWLTISAIFIVVSIASGLLS
jgi:hypothetical protein